MLINDKYGKLREKKLGHFFQIFLFSSNTDIQYFTKLSTGKLMVLTWDESTLKKSKQVYTLYILQHNN